MAEKRLDVIIKALDQTVPGFRTARSNVQEFASEAKKLLAEAFAFEKIGEGLKEFFKGSLEKSGEAERAWSQLANTVANIGISFAAVRPELEAHIKQLQQVTNVRTDEAIKGFDKLVSVTGDYHKSLANMQLVADVAARKQIEFSEAAQLVGRVMAGTGLRVLKEFGISTHDAALATEELRAKVKGAAETELKTFEGQLKNIKAGFGDFQEEVGDTIAHNSVLRQMLSDIANSFRNLGHWVEENKTQFTYWVAFIVAGVKGVAMTFVDLLKIAYDVGRVMGAFLTGDWDQMKEAARGALTSAQDIGVQWANVALKAESASNAEVEGLERTRAELDKNRESYKALKEEEAAAAHMAAQKKLEEALDKRITLLEKAGALTQFHGQALESLRFLEHGVTEALKDGNLTMERRLQLEDRLAKIRGARTKLKDPELSGAMPFDIMLGDLRRQGELTLRPEEQRALEDKIRLDILANSKSFVPTASQLPTIELGTQLAVKFDAVSKKLSDGKEHLVTFGDVLSDLVVGPVAAFGTGIENAMQAMVSGSGKAGAAFRAAMMHAIADVSRMLGNHFLANALAADAKTIGGNPLGIAERIKWMAAAAAMYAVAGSAGGMAGGGSSGGGGGGGYPGSNGSLTRPSTATLKVVGRFLDMNDPLQRDALSEALQQLSGLNITLVQG